MRPLEFGWYLPTHGDTTAYGVMEAQVPGSPELCDRVVQAAEAAGFEYLLIPVGSVCWEAWITGAFMAARSSKIKPLIAARPGYINPVLLAKMISTFDQMSGGRIWDHPRPGEFPGQVSHAVRRAYPAAAAAAAVSEILSRRRLARSLGNVGEAFRRASVLGRSAGTYRGQHRRDQGDGTGA